MKKIRKNGQNSSKTSRINFHDFRDVDSRFGGLYDSFNYVYEVNIVCIKLIIENLYRTI